MYQSEAEAPLMLPVEVAAVLWADAYRETLRPALVARLTADELAALDRAIEQIERSVFEGKPKLALSV
ncbi:hypothetical protein [Chloroflexus sp.]|uniref:hypothetical protein n=1 Tax=Chloroflexus sp. TaxID=1904827 RepID=UPI002ACDC858|nr:hypothetical protein [Chloroflexus sp.]